MLNIRLFIRVLKEVFLLKSDEGFHQIYNPQINILSIVEGLLVIDEGCLSRFLIHNQGGNLEYFRFNGLVAHIY